MRAHERVCRAFGDYCAVAPVILCSGPWQRPEYLRVRTCGARNAYELWHRWCAAQQHTFKAARSVYYLRAGCESAPLLFFLLPDAVVTSMARESVCLSPAVQGGRSHTFVYGVRARRARLGRSRAEAGGRACACYSERRVTAAG